MNAFVKFSNFMSQDRAFDSHCRFLGRALYKMIVLGEGFGVVSQGFVPGGGGSY